MRRTLLFALLCAGMLFTGNTKSQDVQKSASAEGVALRSLDHHRRIPRHFRESLHGVQAGREQAHREF